MFTKELKTKEIQTRSLKDYSTFHPEGKNGLYCDER